MNPLALRCYRLLLRLVAPRDLRVEYGEQMEDVFADLLTAARRQGRLATIQVWIREAVQLIGVARQLGRDGLTRRQRLARTLKCAAEGVVTDGRLALRALRRQPVFAGAVAATLAIGLGVSLIAFSSARVSILSPLPIEEPDGLIVVTGRLDTPRWSGRTGITARELEAIRTAAPSLVDLSPFSLMGDATLVGHGPSERMRVMLVAPSYFDIVRTEPQLGRLFTDTSADADELPPVVLAEHVWRKTFGSDPSVVGRRVELSGRAYRVTGILGRDHWGLTRTRDAIDAWLPLSESPHHLGRWVLSSLNQGAYWGVARLRPGASLDTARQELARAHEEFAREHVLPVSRTADAVGLREFYFSGGDRTLAGVGFGALLVLVVCALNVVFLLGLRLRQRGEELHVRRALGGSRGRVSASLLGESFVLAAVGGTGALLLATLVVRGVLDEFEAPFLHFAEVTIGVGPAFATVAGAFLLTSLAGWIGRPDLPVTAPGQGGRVKRRKGRYGHARLVVAAESALAVIALVAATLSARSLERLTAVELGYDPTGLEAVRVDLRGSDFDHPGGSTRFARTMHSAMAAQGERSVGVLGPDMMGRSVTHVYATPQGRDPSSLDEVSRVQWISVSPGTLGALGVEWIEGRDLSWEDGPDDPVAVVVSEQTARHLWPGRAALGQRFHLNQSRELNAVVVGVVKPVRHVNRYSRSSVVGDAYFSIRQRPTPSLTVLHRDPAGVIGSQGVASAIRSVDARLAPFDGRSMTRRLADETGGLRLVLTLTALYGAIALALALCGIISVTATIARERRREIAVRSALGAMPRRLVWTVARGTVAALTVGLACGTYGAFLALDWIDGVLFGVSATDVWSFAGVTLVVFATGILSCLGPARAGVRDVPAEVMRYG